MNLWMSSKTPMRGPSCPKAEQGWCRRERSAGAGETAEGGARQSGQDPLTAQLRAQRLVELDGWRVPVQHGPFHASAPAAYGDACQSGEQGTTGAPAALGGQDEKIFQIQSRPGQERGIREEVEREADGRSVAFADEGLEVAPGAEAVTTDATKGGLALVRQPLVLREPPDEA